MQLPKRDDHRGRWLGRCLQQSELQVVVASQSPLQLVLVKYLDIYKLTHLN